VDLLEQVPGRPNLIARLGPKNSPALMFAGHLDVVGVEGMTHPPFRAEVRDGKLYGRGSADMKGGIAAMCAAATRAIRSSSRKSVLIAAVVDEEYESLGMRALLDSGVRAEAAVLTEPTKLAICPAHRGFVWMRVGIRGRAAHGSRYDLGIDAITHAGLLLAELALKEIRSAMKAVKAKEPRFDASVSLTTAQAPSDVDVGSPLVTKLASAVRAEGLAPSIEGLSAWTDAALLNEAGVPAVCFGPGDIALAHSAEEWVPIDEIEKAANVLAGFASQWCD
jgi:acetylornithine deacetylase